MKKKGFTLIELVVVMGVMALLLAISVPSYMRHIEDAENIDMLNDMKNLQQLLLTERVNNGKFPDGRVVTSTTLTNNKGQLVTSGGTYYTTDDPRFVRDDQGEVFYTGGTKVELVYTSEDEFKWLKAGDEDTPEPYTNKEGEKGAYMYKGESATVIIPKTIQGTPMINYLGMFVSSLASKVISDNSEVTGMSGMFYNSQAKTLDLSSFDTSNVTDMSSMFRESQTILLDLSSFDTSSATDMSNMFRDCAATKGYAKTQADADKFNSSLNKPATLNFIVK